MGVSRSEDGFRHRPLTFALDTTTRRRFPLSCPDSSADSPSEVNITYHNTSGILGDLHQAVLGNVSAAGTMITTFPTSLVDGAYFVYAASTRTAVDTFTYECYCGSRRLTNGTVNIIVSSAAKADGSVSETVVANTALRMFLAGSHGIDGWLQPEITVLPTKGTLYQYDFWNPTSRSEAITTVPTVVTNPMYALIYDPFTGASGADTFSFRMSHGGLISDDAAVAIDIQAWDATPDVPSFSNVSIVKRQSATIRLNVTDREQESFLGVYITALPSKGKLYQLNKNGTKGDVIDQVFSPYVKKAPYFQYAIKVVNVSSFWGGSADWAPGRAIGSQDCFIYGDCRFSWCPLTADGYGGFASGSDGKGLAFANNPELLFDQYGYTEYIELTYDTPVYASTLLIGKYVRTYVRADLSYSMKLGCAFIC